MNEAMFTFRSYSNAAKAYDTLSAHNIPAHIHRTSAGSASTCGYSVNIPAAYSIRGRDILNEHRIRYVNNFFR